MHSDRATLLPYAFPVMVLGFNWTLPSLCFFFPVKDLHWFPPVQNELDKDRLQSLFLSCLLLCQAKSAAAFLNERGGTCIHYCCTELWEALGWLKLARESHGTE